MTWHPCSSPPPPGPGVCVVRENDGYGGYAYLLATWEPWGDGPPRWWHYPGDDALRIPTGAEWLALEDRQ